MTILDAALELLSLGVWPLPIAEGEKKPPMKEWQNLRLTVDDLREHFSNGGGVACLLGIEPRPIADVDMDCAEAIAAARLIRGPQTERVFGRASALRSHYLFELPGEFGGQRFEDPVIAGQKAADRKQKSMLVEIRGKGQQTVLPPSSHECGERREWERTGEFGKTSLDELRAWVSKLAAAALLARYWPKSFGARMALGGALAHAGWIKEDAVEFVSAVIQIAMPGDRDALHAARTETRSASTKIEQDGAVTGLPTLTRELGERGKIIVRSVTEWLRIERQGFPATDGENADRFAEQHYQDLRYCTEQRIWYAWNGKKWQRDAIGEVSRRARETAETIWDDARKTPDNDEEGKKKKKDRMRWAVRADSKNGLDFMIAIARYDSRIEATRFAETFDRDPMLLNCQNGIVNLETGEIGPHRREAMMTKIVPVACDPKRDITKFLAYVSKTFDTSDDMIKFMQRFGGYCLSGLTGEQAFFIVYGKSETGKSTYVKLMHGLMGEYAVQIPGKVLLDKPAHQRDYDTALLAGVRLASSVETGADKKLDEEAIKAITGQDTLRGERKYENSFDFRSQAKLILATNYRPNIGESDDAIWRRIKPIPFHVTVPDEDRVDSFEEKLIDEEGPGILAWYVAGAVEWKKQGLDYPAEVATAAASYRREQDEVQEFLDECTQIDGIALTSKAALFAEYAAQAAKAKMRPMTKKRFGMEMKRLGYEEGSGRDHVSWKCVRFNTQVQKAIDDRIEREKAVMELAKQQA